MTECIEEYDHESIDNLPYHARTRLQFYLVRVLNKQGKEKFAKALGVDWRVVKSNWIRPDKKPLKDHYTLLKVTRGRPTNAMFELIARATKGYCTYQDVLDHFCPSPTCIRKKPSR